jgi:hypothetical protein
MSEQYEALMHSMNKNMERLVNAAEEIGIQMGRMNDIAYREDDASARPARCPECVPQKGVVWYAQRSCEGCGSTWGIEDPEGDTP